jgi:hypothetical protein
MDEAWRKYLKEKPQVPGFNPKQVFYAGWLASLNSGSARSSGWSSGEEAVDDV